MSIWDRWQRDEIYRKSQLVHEWSDVWMRYLGLIAKIDISHTAPLLQRERYNNHFTCGVSTKISAKKAFVDMHKQVRQDCGVPFIRKVEGNACKISSILQCKRYLEWLRTTWAGYFAEEQPQPTSSSFWTPSSSWWTSSSWTWDWHQHEWKDSAWCEKW